jgi:hypothetical protein
LASSAYSKCAGARAGRAAAGCTSLSSTALAASRSRSYRLRQMFAPQCHYHFVPPVLRCLCSIVWRKQACETTTGIKYIGSS